MKTIKYVLGFFLILGGLGCVFKGTIIGGLLFLLLGIIFLPPVSLLMDEKLAIWRNRYARYGLYVGIFLIASSIIRKSETIVSDENPVAKSQIVTNEIDRQEEEPMDLDNSKFWEKFDPIVKQRIYKMIKEKDCAGLQQEFNVTADNMDRLQASGMSGSRNLDLMSFLEGQMKEMGCH